MSDDQALALDRDDVRSGSTRALDDELHLLCPDASLTHLLRVVSCDPLDVALAALAAVRASGADLQAFRVTRVGIRSEHRIGLKGLRSAEARRLADGLRALPGVEQACVEHQLLRRPAAASG